MYQIFEMTDRIYSFPPIIDEKSKVLILGSIPGVKSLEKQEYYAHPQNQFWRLMFNIFEEDYCIDYQIKIALLKKNKIALWDAIESCEREGSLDTKIKNEVGNSVKDLLQNYPNITAIFCNGQKAHKNLIKQLGKDYHLPIILLPSTSPAHTLKIEKKREEWQKILQYIED